MRMLIGTVALVGLFQAGPVILTSDDIGDNYYDAPPTAILEPATWLGCSRRRGSLTNRHASRISRSRGSASHTKGARAHRLSARHQSTRR